MSLRQLGLPLLEHILKILEHASTVINLFAVVVIVGGFVLAAVLYLSRFRKITPDQNFKHFKIKLGNALILGTEILVLADVIETITVTPTFQSLTVLAVLIIVRTVLSWTLTLEVEGCWPWQTPAKDHGEQDHA